MKFALMLLLIGVITLSVGVLTSPLMPWWQPLPLLRGFVTGWGVMFIVSAIWIVLTED